MSRAADTPAAPVAIETYARYLPDLIIEKVVTGDAAEQKATAEQFLRPASLKLFALGLVAFSVATASGVIFGKVMNLVSRDPVNPIIREASRTPLLRQYFRYVRQGPSV